ncbi:unnamed protein product, partial [Hapterophycus canaliculatus]
TTALVGGFLLARSIHNNRRARKTSLMLLPEARRSDHTDEYFGHTVEDPYRWLEQEDGEETKEWVEAQIKV